MTDAEIVQALQAAIPGFHAVHPVEPLPRGDRGGALAWLERLLGESFCRYVEWKEFSSWGFEGVQALHPIQAAGITLSIDELFDADDGLPLGEDDDIEPYEFFLRPLNRQLAANGLQLVEFGAEENPRLVCVRSDLQTFGQLSAALSAAGVEMPDVEI